MLSLIPQFVATLGATFGAFSLGTVISWPSNALQNGTGYAPDDLDFEFDSNVASWIVSLFMIGAAVVPWVGSLIFPFLGKKYTMIAACIPFIGGWLIMVFASNTGMLLAGRFITGFSGGLFCLAAPSYSSEIAETKYRGALGAMMQLMITCGILFVNINCSTNWKVLTGVCIIFPSLSAIWMIFMPKSPIYLVSKGDIDGARKSLTWFRGGASVDVSQELEELKSKEEERIKTGSVSLKALCTEKRYLKPLGIVLVLMALQQLSGINYVLSYSTLIFESAGTSIDTCLSAMLIGIVQVVFTLITTLIIDRFGRKILLIISEVIICISMIGVGVFFILYESCDACNSDGSNNSTGNGTLLVANMVNPDFYVSEATVDSIGFLPLACLMIFVAAFSLGFGPIPWILNVELIPPEARALSSSLASTFNWLVSFLVAQFVPTIGEAIGSGPVYFIFSGIALLGTVFIVIFVPETKGKSEEEIKEIFSK